MARTIQVWYGDVNSASPVWENVSFWVPGLSEVDESELAYEKPSSLDHKFWAEREGQASPLVPRSGMEVLYLVYDDVNPLLSDYRFHGKINIDNPTPVIEDKHIEVKCDDMGEDLLIPITDMVFYADDTPGDTDRVKEAIEQAVAQHGLGGTWDTTSYIPASNFVEYEAGTRTPYHMQTLADILADISHYAGPDGDVPARRLYLSGAWSDPNNPGTGGANAVIRVVHYYSGSQAAREPVPLTDRADGKAYYLYDSFSEVVGQPGFVADLNGQAAETGQNWAALVGAWEQNGGGAARLATHAGEDILVADAVVSDGEVSALFLTRGLGQALAFRVTSHPADVYKWQGFVLRDNSTNYLLRRYQSGSYTTLATIAVAPGNNTTVKAVLDGSTIRIYIGGSLAATVTDAFNQTAHLYGIAANSGTSATWDNVGVWGTANRLYGLKIGNDRTAMINIVGIQGPESDPAPVGWTGEVNAEGASDGDITKTANTDAWDSGAVSEVEIIEDGGYVVAALEETQKVWDGFERQDNESGLGTAPSGQEWALAGTSAAAAIRGGTALFTAGTGPLYAIADSKVGTGIHEIRFPTVVVGQRLVFRFSDAANLWYVEQQAASYKVYKRVAGIDTLMATHTVTPASGDTIKVSFEGTSIKLYRNGAGPHATITDAHNQTATKHGFGTASSLTATFDDVLTKQTFSDMAFGLGFASSVDDYDEIDFGWKLTAARTAQPVELGTLVGSSRTYAMGERLGVHVKHVLVPGAPVVYQVTYTVNDQVVFVSTQNPVPSEATPMYAQSAIYHRGATLSNVEMARYAYSIHTDDASISDYGPKPHNQIIKRDDAPTFADRGRIARSIFTRHGQPRQVIKGYTTEEYKPGRIAILNAEKPGFENRLTVIAAVKRVLRPKGREIYNLTLNEADLEFGDEEPIGFLYRNELEDRRKPLPPQNFASSPGTRDGAATVSHNFTFDVPRDGVRWVYIYLKPVGGTPWEPMRFIAAGGRVEANGLPADTRFKANARFEDWNRNVSDLSAEIQFTTATVGLLPAPTFASTKSGIDKKGGWQGLTVNPVPGAVKYDYWYKKDPRGLEHVVPGSPTPSLSMTLYGQPVPSTRYFKVFAIDSYGEYGIGSDWQAVTVYPSHDSVAPSNFNAPDPDDPLQGWVPVSPSTEADFLIDGSVAADAATYSLRMTVPASTTKEIESFDYGVKPASVLSLAGVVKRGSGTGTAPQASIWARFYNQDRSAQVGSDQQIVAAFAPSTTFSTLTKVQVTVPAGAYRMVFVFKGVGQALASTYNLWWAFPYFERVKDARDLSTTLDLDSHQITLSGTAKLQGGNGKVILDDTGLKVKADTTTGLNNIDFEDTAPTKIGTLYASGLNSAGNGILRLAGLVTGTDVFLTSRRNATIAAEPGTGTVNILGGVGSISVGPSAAVVQNVPLRVPIYEAVISSKTANFTADATTRTYECKNTSDITATLPAAAGCAGRQYTFKRLGTHKVTIDGNGSETIDGIATFPLSQLYHSVTIESDGTNWIIVNQTGLVLTSDGTRWLGPPISQSMFDANNPGGVEATYTGTLLIGRWAAPSPHIYKAISVTWSLYVQNNASGHSSSHRWTLRWGTENAGGGGSVESDVNSFALSTPVDTRFAIAGTTFTNVVYDFSTSSTFDVFLEVRKDTGTPGTLHLYGVNTIWQRVYS